MTNPIVPDHSDVIADLVSEHGYLTAADILSAASEATRHGMTPAAIRDGGTALTRYSVESREAAATLVESYPDNDHWPTPEPVHEPGSAEVPYRR